jgi:hypothetical protein
MVDKTRGLALICVKRGRAATQATIVQNAWTLRDGESYPV